MKFFGRKVKLGPITLLARRDNLLSKMDFVLDTLENSKFDILYMENLKNPLTPDERVYFIQQIDRIESAKKTVLWMKENAKNNTPFWRRLLKW
jgi:hypothetical protein